MVVNSLSIFWLSGSVLSLLCQAGGVLRHHSISLHFQHRVEGVLGSKDFRMFFLDQNQRLISPWHNISLYHPDGYYNMIVEIPKFTLNKMEIQTKLPHNPIAQDTTSDGKIRHYFGPLYWNYGAFPQTWEDPSVKGGEEVFNSGGDGDPVDVVEVGGTPLPMGSVVPVKILGALAMIDQGELDWKILAIRKNETEGSGDKDLTETVLPRLAVGIREWFRWYKTPAGKGLNKFGFDEKLLSVKEAEQVLADTHQQYLDLILAKVKSGKMWIRNNKELLSSE